MFSTTAIDFQGLVSGVDVGACAWDGKFVETREIGILPNLSRIGIECSAWTYFF